MKERWYPDGNSQAKAVRVVLILFLVVLLGIGALYWFGQKIERGSKNEEQRGDLSSRFTAAPAVVFQGERYQPRTKLSTILIIGVDQDPMTQTDRNGYRNGGQSDYLMLLVINEENQTVTPIQIDRDTIAEVTVLGVLGNITGTRSTQICLAHGFGDGGEQSCQLTRDAVSRLFLGIDIQYYLAMDLDGIAALNDALGGVTVTLQDDFTVLDPEMFRGATITLKGIQSEYFVRSRMNIGIGTNASRMLRQQLYWEGLNKQLMLRLDQAKRADFVGELFDLMSPYLITDMKRGRMINEVWNTRSYQRLKTLHPAGDYSVGSDGFVEFHTDDKALESLIIQTFYQIVSQ